MKHATILGIVSAILLGTCQFTAVAAEKKYGPGVTDTEIKIGQTVPYSGPASAFSSYGRVMAGYFQMLNEKELNRRGSSWKTTESLLMLEL